MKRLTVSPVFFFFLKQIPTPAGLIRANRRVFAQVFPLVTAAVGRREARQQFILASLTTMFTSTLSLLTSSDDK